MPHVSDVNVNAVVLQEFVLCGVSGLSDQYHDSKTVWGNTQLDPQVSLLVLKTHGCLFSSSEEKCKLMDKGEKQTWRTKW